MSYDAPADPLPSSVNVAATLLLISGALTVLRDAVILLARGSGSDVLLILLSLVFGGLSVRLGLQLRKLVPGARNGAIVLCAASILVSLLLIPRGGGSAVVGMILPALVIVLMYRSATRAAFPRS